MAVTVGSILAIPALGLRLLTGDAGLAREVRWAATSELLDPTPFLEGGELLLSTGMNLPTRGPELAAYFDRLVRAQVAAFGLGLGLTFDEVPDAVVRAARERSLPLLSVPRPTPFIAVTRALAEMIAEEQRDELTRALQVQRRLVDAALTRDGSRAVLRVLASALDGWAALLDVGGGVRLSAGEGADERAAALAFDVARVGSRSLHASAALDVEGGHVVLQPIGAVERVTGVLAVGASQRFSPARRSIVAGAVAVLSLEPDHARRSLDTARATRAAVLRLLLLGRASDAEAVASAAGLPLPSGPVRALVARPAIPEQDAATTTSRSGDLRSRVEGLGISGLGISGLGISGLGISGLGISGLGISADHRLLAGLLDDRLVAVMEDDPILLKGLRAILESTAGARAGISGPGTAAELPALFESARHALRAAEQTDRPWLDAAELGSLRLLSLLDADLLRAQAEAVLAPLASYGRNRDDLLASLRSWLEHGGHWDETASALGIHRNTLRYRIRRLEQLTGRDLSSMHDRVEFWLALQAADLFAAARTEPGA